MVELNELIGRMTLDEKISLLAGKDLWYTVPIPRLGIPSIKTTDGPNGARGALADMGPTSDLFPVGTALGATWNPELVQQVGGALAEEVKSKGAHVLLGPTVNIHRVPIAGRNFECFSEDPYLSGKVASAYIRGLQGKGVSACIKHFACNDQEFQRTSISAEVDERAQREIYLEPFRIALEEAKPWSIMSSYNRLNGTYASENDYLLKSLLKEEWEFDGAVISDWVGTYSDRTPAGGLDLEMPGPARWMREDIVRRALESGALTQEQLDDKVRRILRLIQRVGSFDQPSIAEERGDDRPEHRALIRKVGQESIVLLKNEGGLLPLDPGRIKTIAVIGELAERPNVKGGGSSRVSPHYVVSPLEGVRARAGESARVEYALGCMTFKGTPELDSRYVKTDDGAANGLRLTIFEGLDCSGTPVFDTVTRRSEFEWWREVAPDLQGEQFSARLSGLFTASQAGKHTFGLRGRAQGRLFIDDQVIIDGGKQLHPYAEQIGEVQLAAGQSAKIRVEYQSDGLEEWRFLHVGHRQPVSDDPIAEAVALAKRADAVIVIAGLTNEWESEGFDRADMELPGRQNELIDCVAEANPNTIVVLNAGSPLRMPWIDRVRVVVEQWYNGQECGNALADVLFGDVSPSGKLPTTFPKRYEDNPTVGNYPGEHGKVFYREGIFVGYRHYDAKGVEPLFPFGHGLSYTTFAYSNIQLGKTQIAEDEGLEVSLEVRNAGTRAGREIAQLYVHDVESTTARPEQELKGFAKIELQPGETKTVRFHLDREAFWYYDASAHAWRVEPGEFEIRAGGSSRDLPLRAGVTITPATRGAREHGPRQ